MHTYTATPEEIKANKRKYDEKRQSCIDNAPVIKPDNASNILFPHSLKKKAGEFTPTYKIPDDTVIQMHNGDLMTYQQIEERICKYENVLARIQRMFEDDLSGFDFD